MIGALQHIDCPGRHLSEDPHREPRAREGVAVNHLVRQAEGHADAPYLVLEQLAQRFHEAHLHALGQAADVVV